jgi:hypothetical protein
MKATTHRHFSNDQADWAEVERHVRRAKRLRSHIGWTNWAGIVLGLGSWVAFLIGALSLIFFRSAPTLI